MTDFGCVVDGYFRPDPRCDRRADGRAELYELVLRPTGIQGAVPTARYEVDADARSVIEQAGYGEHFDTFRSRRRLKVHEEFPGCPLREAELEPGMVCSVEPGVPGWGGIRIEDLVR